MSDDKNILDDSIDLDYLFTQEDKSTSVNQVQQVWTSPNQSAVITQLQKIKTPSASIKNTQKIVTGKDDASSSSSTVSDEDPPGENMSVRTEMKTKAAHKPVQNPYTTTNALPQTKASSKQKKFSTKQENKLELC